MSRATTITGPLLPLVTRAGGVGELARELGVSVKAVWTWGTERHAPSGLARRALNGWAKRHRLAEPYPECPACGGRDFINVATPTKPMWRECEACGEKS